MRMRRLALVGLTICLLLVSGCWPWLVNADTGFSVHFIDVGQGDAILLDYGTHELLVDGGRSEDCASYIGPYIDGQIEVVVATHMDADYIGGLDEVFERFDVESVWTNGNTADTEVYRDFRDAYLLEGSEVRLARRGETVWLGDLEIAILHPVSIASDRNQNSIVLWVSINGVDFLLTGDIDSSIEDQLISSGLISNAEILKISHHGSNSATSAGFLEAADPLVCVISVSATNQYGHPGEDVLNRIACDTSNCLVFRTDVHGSTVLSVDVEGRIFYRTENDSDPLKLACSAVAGTPPPPPSPAAFEIYRVQAVAECITIRNTGDTASDLGGWTISDGEGNYTFPSGTLVAAGATHTVCMETYNPTRYTRGLYLNNDSDCVLLFAPGSWETVDSVCW
jgi:beta-lactamase superfamily II metal-dependent hydrolase